MMQCVHNYGAVGWFCGLVRRKQVSFVALLVQIGLVGFGRVSNVRVGTRVSVSWSLTSLFSTNMAISETKGQGWKIICTQ